MEVEVTKNRTVVGIAVFDDDFPYADRGWHPEADTRYLRGTLQGHPIAKSKGRILAHRAVAHWAFGEGEQNCALCGWHGLSWAVDDPKDVDHYLAIDHVSHGRKGLWDCTKANLRSCCRWCNDGRSTAERLGIPLAFFADIAPSKRPALKQVGSLQPTPTAIELAAKKPWLDTEAKADAGDPEVQMLEEIFALTAATPAIEEGTEKHRVLQEGETVAMPASFTDLQDAMGEAENEAAHEQRYQRRRAKLRKLWPFGRAKTKPGEFGGLDFLPGERFAPWSELVDVEALGRGEVILRCDSDITPPEGES